MNARLLSLLALVAFVSAQSSSPSATVSGAPTDTSGTATPSGAAGLPQCITDCIQQAATTVGCDPTDLTCLCTNQDFQAAVVTCGADCTPAEQQQGLAAQAAQCSAASGTASGPASGTASATGSATTVAVPTASVTSPVVPPSSRPIPSVASSVRPVTSNAASTAASTSTASTSANPNAASPLAFDGVWALAAGILGIAVAV